MSSVRPKVIAQYFPQLHAIPENDRWWGKGFTDWHNVRRGQPLFPGHNQPRVPLGGDYYDQSQERVIRRQVELAKSHGVYGFCHYHYWFNGKQLLEKPTNILLANKDIDMPFCLAWANETWSRRWDGQEHRILIEQTHPPTIAAWSRHFDRLIQAWTDERYIRVDGKPMFLIYRPTKINQLGSMLDYWQTRAREHGLPGVHFVSIVQGRFAPWETQRLFDAAMLFEPFTAHMSLVDDGPPVAMWRQWGGRQVDKLPLFLRDPVLNVLKRHERPRIVDYDRVWAQIIARKSDPHLPTYRGAFVDWDNTARYQRRATVFHGANPQRFGHWMKRLVDDIAHDPLAQDFVFLNAWNEWAEGAYLEPDERHRYGYLEALRDAVAPPVASAQVA